VCGDVLLDIWMPTWDFRERHAIAIDADRERVYQALLGMDIARLPLVRLLMSLRAAPALIASPRTRLARLRHPENAHSLTLRTVLGHDFALLAEEPPTEIVMGLTGQFWTLSGSLVPTDPATFRDQPPAGTARAAWNFHLADGPASSSVLSTETRVRCADEQSRRAFGRYWRVVRWGSGLIRRAILQAVRGQAKRASAR
jgi:hypothetical protein